MGRNKSKEKSISRYGHFEWKIQGGDGVKVAYAALGGSYRVRNRNQEIGREWPEIMVEEEGRTEGWMFQHRKRYLTKIVYME